MARFTEVGPDAYTTVEWGVGALACYPLMTRVRQRGPFLLAAVSCENNPEALGFLQGFMACAGLVDSSSPLRGRGALLA